MKRVAVLLALAFSLVAPGAAWAEAKPQTPPAAGKAAAKKQAKAEKKGIPAEKLRHEIDGRIARAREKLEHHIEKKKLSAEKSAAARNEFNAGVVHVRAKLDAVSKGGVVTREDAREVRSLARQIKTRGK
jgi:hypothetical protein